MIFFLFGSADIQVAVGLINGRIALRSFGSAYSLTKELTPKTLRPCADLSWSRADPSLLAGGFDKAKGDGGVLVFDVQKTAVKTTYLNPAAGQTRSG